MFCKVLWMPDITHRRICGSWLSYGIVIVGTWIEGKPIFRKSLSMLHKVDPTRW